MQHTEKDNIIFGNTILKLGDINSSEEKFVFVYPGGLESKPYHMTSKGEKESHCCSIEIERFTFLPHCDYFSNECQIRRVLV